MKLFKQLLVAPAALGLLAPVAAQAADLNINGVSKYAADEQVTSISQFADVKPTDWAYQALSNLIERYGCVAGYPNGTFKGGQAMTRFEAAALLNACLDRVTETTDELKKLMTEFQKELAILKGRVDGLDARVGVLEANQFSTTTKLKGIATMVIGGSSNGLTAQVSGQPALASTMQDHITFNYDVKLNLDTSFTGKDLLRTTLRSNNFQNSSFGAYGSAALEVASTPSNTSADAVGINRLFYQFPVGSNWTATFGAKVRQDDMLAMAPTAYNADSILYRLSLAGASTAYNNNLGAGAGLSYKNPNGFNLSVNYISNQNFAGNSATVNAGAGPNSGSGIGAASTTTAQVGYAASNWGAAFVYNYSNYAQSVVVNDVNASYNSAGSNNLGFSAYWQPKTTGFIPSISAGVGTAYYNGNNPTSSHTTWQVALQWNDAVIKGNALGMAYGSTEVGGAFLGSGGGENFQPASAYEVFYKFQVTDNISVTPAFFWINGQGNNADQTGGLVKTTFKF
jgi:hypothetical protein